MPRSNTSASEVVAALLARPPHWLLHSGTGLLAFGFVLLLAFAALIRYPDVVRGEARVTTAAAPVDLPSLPGELQSLLAAEGDTVAAGQVLAVFAQDLPYALVQALHVWLDSAVQDLRIGRLPSEPPRPNQTLGSLQVSHAILLRAWEACRLDRQHNLLQQGSAAAHDRLGLLSQQNQRLAGQDSLWEERLRIAHARYQADSSLLTKGAASLMEVEASRAHMLQVQEALAEARAAVLARDLDARATAQDIARLDLEQARSASELEGQLWRAIDGLRAEIGHWEEAHLLRAPFAGVLRFAEAPTLGQQLGAGQSLGWLLPLKAGGRVAHLRIPVDGAGKVERGQQVLLSLADYPRAEFGTLAGRVRHLSPLPLEGHYLVEVDLPDGLRSSLGRMLPLRGESIGRGEIVTQERSLLGRVLGSLRVALE